MRVTAGTPLRVLDFDIENRPLSYWRPDRPTAEVTAIAWAWVDDPFTVHAAVLGRATAEQMLNAFLDAYNAADMVTGHYIRNHDLPIVNGALTELGLPNLGPKLSQDTKNDLIKWADIPKSQEHLAEMLGVPAPKVGMSQHRWREANRLTERGLEATYERVTGDVRQHMALRAELLKRGLLGAPRVWRP